MKTENNSPLASILPAFPLGRTMITPGARDALLAAAVDPLTLLTRHVHRDWGDLCSEDTDANNQALTSGRRIFSKYDIKGQSFYVITEADRSSTTILLPEEY